MSDTQTRTPAPKRSRFERNHDRIYDAAIGLFAARGPDAVTMEDIAVAVGMSRSSIFNHFPSKNLILATFFTRMTSEIIAEARAKPMRGFRHAIIDLGRIAGAHATHHGPIVAAIAGLTAPSQPLAPAEQATDAAMRTYLLALIRAGQAKGEVRNDHSAHALANLLLAVLTASAHEWVAGGQGEDLSTLLEGRYSLVLDGLMQKS
ncbi:TetR/AcrR family transcriptional regulator [uncultured Maricaulis sp.]|uniref:TetR/AcrR family transcriptional regulator n=1 Tax=uncultured Maricaulis sp. TaxID=174710 RepID=UPI00261F4E45|nr:TetR/AcrR family transcriptional regulator [uncultured Maricaulis sp.]